MRGIAILLLMIIALPIFYHPFIEMNLIIIDKAKVDSAVRNAGRLAINTSTSEENRAMVKSDIDKIEFVKKFSGAFEKALELKHTEITDNAQVRYKTLNDKFNDFNVNFDWSEKIEVDTNGNTIIKNICKVSAISPYKFKTKYLKLYLDNDFSTNVFNITSDKTFVIQIDN